MDNTEFKVDKEKLEIRMSRVFDAAREKVWQAHVDSKLIEKWWGLRRFTTVVEKLDAKVGGEWKFINRAEGQDHVFYGEFREVVKPEKIVWTFTYAPYPDSVAVDMLTLEELLDGKTKLSTLSKYPSTEALEGMLQGGMEAGARETWDRLAELVGKA